MPQTRHFATSFLDVRRNVSYIASVALARSTVGRWRPRPWRKCCWHDSGRSECVREATRHDSPKYDLMSRPSTPLRKRCSGRIWVRGAVHDVRKSSTVWCSLSGRGNASDFRRLSIARAAHRVTHAQTVMAARPQVKISLCLYLKITVKVHRCLGHRSRTKTYCPTFLWFLQWPKSAKFSETRNNNSAVDWDISSKFRVQVNFDISK